ncbi:MAG: heme NO-binding domain-containing protein [Sandaracinaceae bacterium]|nr:heme NO-binding domain-containing protein [Sandaracinaceae bacterium]
MKGIVFTELLEMVEERYSLEVVDRIIERAELPSGGVYTAVGTYPHAEMGRLLRELSAATGAPPRSCCAPSATTSCTASRLGSRSSSPSRRTPSRCSSGSRR